MVAPPGQRSAILAAGLIACLMIGMIGTQAAGNEPALPQYRPDAIPLSQYQTSADLIGSGVGSSNHHAPGLTSQGNRAPEFFLAIFSGSPEGSYFRVASVICNVMAQRFTEHHIRCVPLRSLGVSSNVELMRQGRAQVMLVQSDTNWRAATGTHPIPAARSVSSLHDESGLLVARRDAAIRSLADLRGKRISAGTAGSGARQLWTDLLQTMGMRERDFRVIFDLAQSFYEEGVCSNRIDAFGLWIGHPAPLVERALEACPLTLAGMDGPWVDRMIEEKPYYVRQTIPAGTYAGQNSALATYGLKAMLVADKRANSYVVYWLTRVLVENAADLRARTPILATLDPESMFRDGNFLPFHPGAERYWRDRGFLPETEGEAPASGEQTSEDSPPAAP